MSVKMKKNIPKTNFFSDNDLALLELPQIFSAGAVWLESGMENVIATFDLIVRDLPKNRNFLVFSGLEEIVALIKRLRYSKKDVKQLLEAGAITPKFADYLKEFKFAGDLYAMKEGTVFFPGEPVIRVEAPIIEANMLTMLLLIGLPSNTTFLSKVIRSVIVKGDKVLVTGGGMRANSFETALKFARAAYISGVDTGPNTIGSFTRRFGLKHEPVCTNAYHAYIKSFPSELEAMDRMAELFDGNINVMIDTYNMNKGLDNFITLCHEYNGKSKALPNLIIDSGDLYNEAVKVRKRLDLAGLKDVKITIAGNLDEFRIQDYVKRGIPADVFLMTTEALTVSDDPKLEVVYKLAELRDKEKVTYTAKFAKGKESYPGRKQVFRQMKKGKLKQDIIGLDSERLGQKMLLKVIDKGRLVYMLPDIDQIKENVKKEVNGLPMKYLDIDRQYSSPVKISEKLSDMFLEVKRSHA